MVWLGVAALALMPLGCSNAQSDALDAPGGGSTGSPGSGAGVTGGVMPGDPSGEEPILPPEQELEQDFRVPVSTGRFVWTANPESNRVALIDAVDFGVVTLDAGFGPTYLAALPNPADDRSGAIVINDLSSDATLFLARDTSDVLVSDPIFIHPDANAWAISESGRWAVAWTNARRIENADPTEGFQDVTVLDLSAYPDDEPLVTRLSVGYRPTQIVFADDEERAFAITEPGVSVIELTGGEGPLVSRDVVVSDEPASEVAITPSGELALVRQDGSSEIVVVELDTGERRSVALPGAVTDLDLSRDASFAVAVIRGVFESGDEPKGILGGAGQAGEGGQTGAGGEGVEEPAAAGGAGGAPGQEPGFSNSVVAILPIPDVFVNPASVTSVSIPELFGSVVVPASGDNVLLFTNAADSDRVTILDTQSESWRSVELKAPVRALFATEDGGHAVGLLAPPAGSSKAGAFSLLPVSQNLPPKLQGTEAPTLGVAVSDESAVITTRDAASSVFGAYLAGFPSLRVDPVELPSAPTASGIVVEAGQGFVAQEHAEGRITFVDLDSARARTLTGFELGLKVVDGD